MKEVVVVQETYISKEEREKCRRVMDAFSGKFEDEDLLVFDGGRYGFVKVQYFKLPMGFDSVFTFFKGEDLFNDLWEDWYNSRLLEYAMGTPMVEMDYDQIFRCMPKEKQEALMQKKAGLRKAAGLPPA
ncbi:MAG: hypothetical protein NC246_15965 [Muribaculaceae bacterium]|nr:hypothetical protein [Muribaculaceae bacterium]